MWPGRGMPRSGLAVSTTGEMLTGEMKHPGLCLQVRHGRGHNMVADAAHAGQRLTFSSLATAMVHSRICCSTGAEMDCVGREQAESPLCTPACSMCSMMPQMTTLPAEGWRGQQELVSVMPASGLHMLVLWTASMLTVAVSAQQHVASNCEQACSASRLVCSHSISAKQAPSQARAASQPSRHATHRPCPPGHPRPAQWPCPGTCPPAQASQGQPPQR